jgi:hypothetical protein
MLGQLNKYKNNNLEQFKTVLLEIWAKMPN